MTASLSPTGVSDCSDIISIYQDETGALWFGSLEGDSRGFVYKKEGVS